MEGICELLHYGGVLRDVVVSKECRNNRVVCKLNDVMLHNVALAQVCIENE